jgi:hypothetical protein
MEGSGDECEASMAESFAVNGTLCGVGWSWEAGGCVLCEFSGVASMRLILRLTCEG